MVIQLQGLLNKNACIIQSYCFCIEQLFKIFLREWRFCWTCKWRGKRDEKGGDKKLSWAENPFNSHTYSIKNCLVEVDHETWHLPFWCLYSHKQAECDQGKQVHIDFVFILLNSVLLWKSHKNEVSDSRIHLEFYRIYMKTSQFTRKTCIRLLFLLLSFN